MRIVSVPRRDIDSESHIVFTAGIGKFLQDVALAVFPGALRHCMTAYRIRPEAESVVMLSGDDDAFHTCCLCDRDPLSAIKGGRVEYVGVLSSAAPFRS